jgi:transcriptional regulator with XRE-family HTH domain
MNVAGSLLRTARHSRNLSTRGLAKLAHVNQPGITAVERGHEDATATRLEKLLAPLGCQLSLLPTRLRPVWKAADRVRAALDEGDTRTAQREVIQLSDDLQRAEPATRVALAIAPPTSTGNQRYDALIAAVVDLLLSRDNLPRPVWLDDDLRALSEPWDFEPVAKLREAARAATPEAVRRHGIYLDPAELVSI